MDVLSMFSVKGETAIVTGGGQGIGQEIALGLAEAGADVVVLQRRLEIAEKTAADIRKLGRESLALKVDVSEPSAVEDMVRVVKDVVMNSRTTANSLALFILLPNLGCQAVFGLIIVATLKTTPRRFHMDGFLNSLLSCVVVQ